MELSEEAKRVALETAIKNTASEIYVLCLQINIDPDELDVENPEAMFPENLTEADPNFYTFTRISRACASNRLATRKLALLDSQG